MVEMNVVTGCCKNAEVPWPIVGLLLILVMDNLFV